MAGGMGAGDDTTGKQPFFCFHNTVYHRLLVYMCISPLDCEHLKDKDHTGVLYVYSPEFCAWHVVSP